MFNFSKHEGVVKSGENLMLKVTYNPIIPHLRNVENFEIVDSSFNILRIKVMGESIGELYIALYHYKNTKYFRANFKSVREGIRLFIDNLKL